jgi:hypothetical protein
VLRKMAFVSSHQIQALFENPSVDLILAAFD